MKKIITPLLVLLFVLSSFTLRAQKGTVSGKLMDADTQSPIGYASVMLLNPADSAVVTGDMSDKDGAFAIQNITAGTYLVKVSYMGYLDWFSEPFKLSGGSHDLGTIGLRKDSKMLEGATVVYKKPLFEQKAGKTVMNVESHPGTA
ncbi:MAG: carboxypeptidase regulatory-like domain-containing protein, partial [Bacteroidales bacterium]|nr:carboxypeptidase regulatory-like domain-containing protein [Bacteroidales bacterium]